MSFKERLDKLIDLYIDNSSLGKVDFFLFREDGIPIYSSKKSQAHSIGALVCGLWQASGALMENFQEVSEDAFRLGFDSSDCGLYVLSFCTTGKRYLVSAQFYKCLNPGLLKSKLRKLKEAIKKEVSVNLEEVNPEMVANKNNATKKRRVHGKLFEEVSDEEVENLFHSLGV